MAGRATFDIHVKKFHLGEDTDVALGKHKVELDVDEDQAYLLVDDDRRPLITRTVPQKALIKKGNARFRESIDGEWELSIVLPQGVLDTSRRWKVQLRFQE